MPRRKARRSTAKAKISKKSTAARRLGKRPILAKRPTTPAPTRKRLAQKRPRRAPAGPKAKRTARKTPRLDRVRRTVEDTIPTPPSSLNLDRHGSAARTGRAEIAERLLKHAGMTTVAGGDVDADLESAYFSGDEAPGGDNPTPDQGVVDDIGKALGVEYQDGEELRGSDKVVKRDKHRWELEPASSDDYKERI